MCGIIGYIGPREAANVGIGCLRRLEYRGYDSCGGAVIHDGRMEIRKGAGKIDEINRELKLDSMKGNIGIFHTRWATHGNVSRENAHPHCDDNEKFSIVHNGIIENYSYLKEQLAKKGHAFSSETDTEVIVHLIADYYNGNLKDAVLRALNDLEGSYAICVISSYEPDVIIAAKNESQLVIGLGNGENFIASDIPAILSETKDFIIMENREVAVVSRDYAEFCNLEGTVIQKKIQRTELDAASAEKGLYEHFMLKEIHEQPRAVEDAISNRISEGRVILEGEFPLSANDIKRIIVVACGTSWHAGLVGEFMLEEIARIPTEVEYASEFRYRNPVIEDGTLVIAISQSGETADTLAALREARKKGAKILGIVNSIGSSIAREADYVLYTHAGPEIGVASTKAFTSQLAVLYLLTVYIGDKKGLLPQQQVQNRIRDIRKLPLQMQKVLGKSEAIRKIAEKYSGKNNALYLGRGINYPIALEGALKLKEVSYIHAEGYPAAEMKHGPIALIDEHMPVFFIATKDERTYSKIMGNIEEVKARNGEVIAIASEDDEDIGKKAHIVINIPRSSYILTPLLAVIPLQLLAYHTATLRGCDVDKPRNLAKAVVVE
ncbi:glutamine--fructose-6-phosphate transaminase (isomerizing) [Candidatus Woesearchaeota archaeon]|nr:glutamine--fructose-6-phosphate transaminase (isomerizing) [Candidatus Woesearchaeota archaeon]